MFRTAETLKRLVFWTVTFYWFAIYLHAPIQAPHLYSLGCGGFGVGVIIGTYGFAQMAIRIPLGLRCNRSGRLYPFLLIGAFLIPLTALIRWLGVDSSFWLWVANLLGGMAAAMWIAILAMLGNLFDAADLHRALSYAMAGNSLGMLLATLGCALLASWFTFAQLSFIQFWLGGVTLVLAIGVSVAARKRQPVEKIKPDPALLRSTLRNRRLWRFALLTFVHQGLVLSTVLSFVPTRARAIGATNFEVGLAVFFFWAVTVGVNLLAAKPWMMRLGARFWLPVALLIAAVYCALLGYLQFVWQLYTLQLIGGIFGGIILPFAMSESMREIPVETRTAAIGVFQAILAGGMVFLPPIAGALIEALGERAGFWFLGGVAAAAALYACWITRGLKRIVQEESV